MSLDCFNPLKAIHLQNPSCPILGSESSQKDLKKGVTKCSVPGTHRDVVGQPLSNAELPNFRGDLLPVAWFGHANGCQILRGAEWGRGQQWLRGLGAVCPHCWQLWEGRDLPHLRGHAADGGDIISSVEEVDSVRLQLELTQPVVNGFCILGRGQDTEQPMMVAAGAGRT